MNDLKKSFWKNIHFGRVVVWYGVNQTILHNSEVSIFCPFFSSSFSQNHPGAKFLNSVPQPAVTTLPSLLHNSFSMPPTLLRFWLVKMLQVSCNMHTKNNLNVCIKTETVTDTVGADAMVYSYVRLLFTCISNPETIYSYVRTEHYSIQLWLFKPDRLSFFLRKFRFFWGGCSVSYTSWSPSTWGPLFCLILKG